MHNLVKMQVHLFPVFFEGYFMVFVRVICAHACVCVYAVCRYVALMFMTSKLPGFY